MRGITPRRIAIKALLILSAALGAVVTVSQGSSWATEWQAGVGPWGDPDNWTDGLPNFSVPAHIDNGGTAQIFFYAAQSDIGHLGSVAGRSGTVVVGNGGSWASSRHIYVGHGGSGTLVIHSGAQVASVLEGVIAGNTGSQGHASVTGDGSLWTTGIFLDVGRTGTGTLNILNGGEVSVSSGDARIAPHAGSNGTLLVDGTGARLTSSHRVVIGNNIFANPGLPGGQGTMTIQNGGQVTNNLDGIIADGATSNGDVVISNFGSEWISGTGLDVGRSGTGTLEILDGGMASVLSGEVRLGRNSGAGGGIRVAGLNSRLLTPGDLHVGDNGVGLLEIIDGGTVSNHHAFIGRVANAIGVVNVNGPGAIWNNNGRVDVGNTGTATLNILSGGQVSVAEGSTLGASFGSSGTVTVDGVASRWTNVASLTIGSFGRGELNIVDGGLVTSETGDVRIALNADSSGNLVLDGGATLSAERDIFVGTGGLGSVYVDNESFVFNRDTILGSAVGPHVHFDVHGGSKWFNTGRFHARNATIKMSGPSFVYADEGIVIDHQCFVGGNIWFYGNVTNNGKKLPGTSPGTIRIEGDYQQGSTGELVIEMAGTQEEQFDQLVVTGDVMLGGTLTLSFIGGYSPKAGDEVNFLSVGGTLSSAFEHVLLQNLAPGFEFELVPTGESLKMVALTDGVYVPDLDSNLPGDYNRDGIVDAADYTVWRDTLGQMVNHFDDADGDGDGHVTEADYQVWRNGFGNTPPPQGAAAIPEPAGVALLVIGMCLALSSKMPFRMRSKLCLFRRICG